MRALLSVLLVLVMVSPLCATVLVNQNFENGTAGQLVNTLPGWTGSDGILVSSDVIDSGQCAAYNGAYTDTNTWFTDRFAFTNTPNATDTYTLTATIKDGVGWETFSFASVAMAGSGDSGTYNAWIGVGMGDEGSKKIEFYLAAGTQTGLDVTLTGDDGISGAVDVKIVSSTAGTGFYYKQHGSETWLTGATTTVYNDPSLYDDVTIGLHKDAYGWVDSVTLTSTPAPEPTTFALLATGLVGLLAYAWRKRR